MGFGGGPKAPAPLPEAPGIETPSVQEEAEKERRRLAGAKGRASTILADPLNLETVPTAKKFLGN